MSKKVFVTQYSDSLNFTEAGQYGEVVFLTDKEFRPVPNTGHTNRNIVAEMRANLSRHGYIPGRDMIATTGSSVPNVIVGILLADIRGVHNILKWNNRRSNYDLYHVEV